MKAGHWLRGYIAGLVEERRAVPREDLISALIAAEEDGDQLTTEEIVATCNLLLIAGHETTVNLIANAILVMLRSRGTGPSSPATPTARRRSSKRRCGTTRRCSWSGGRPPRR